MTEQWETPCTARVDRRHCAHWYDGDACCGCADPADPAATAEYDETPEDDTPRVV